MVIITFKKFYAQGATKQNSPSHCVTLIKLLVQTALEHLAHGTSEHRFKIKQFENSPLLHKLLCDKVDMLGQSTTNNLKLEESGKKIRQELLAFRKISTVIS